MATARTLVNAVIGTLVAVVFSFVPFSPALGGAVSGFLEGPDGREGAIAGTIAGLIMFVPLAGIGTLFVTFFGFGLGVGVVPAGGFILFLLLFGSLVFGFLVYTVGLSVLGGVLGAYIAREYPAHHASARQTIGMDDSSSRVDRRDGPSLHRDRDPERDRKRFRDQPPVTDDGLEDRITRDSAGVPEDSDPIADSDDRESTADRDERRS